MTSFRIREFTPKYRITLLKNPLEILVRIWCMIHEAGSQFQVWNNQFLIQSNRAKAEYMQIKHMAVSKRNVDVIK